MIVYILDDDATELELWKFYLKKEKPEWAIRTFSTVKDFKDAVNMDCPNIAILDLVLSLENGIEACKWLKSNYPKVQTFINTSMDGEEFKILAERCDSVYLCKNIKFSERVKVIINGGS